MPLSKWTREALEHKADVASETAGYANEDEESLRQWGLVEADCRVALIDDTIVGHRLAAEELENYLGGDTEKAEWRAINVDLARAGFLEKHVKPDAQMGRGPRLITVDGTQYEAW